MTDRLHLLKSKKFDRASDLIDALKNDLTLRHEVEVLAKYFLGRSVSGCGNCYFDAYMELVSRREMKETKFKVKAGAVLYDPVNKDAGKILTMANCTDELALYHLRHNPNCRKYFSVLPENLEELLENGNTEKGRKGRKKHEKLDVGEGSGDSGGAGIVGDSDKTDGTGGTDGAEGTGEAEESEETQEAGKVG
jgi:hypothetical protein